MQLRPYQEDARILLRRGFADGYIRQMLKAPTGAGKTEIAIALAKGAIEKGTTVLLICERISLVEQAAVRFTRAGLRVGILQGKHRGYDPSAPIQCASAQTLARRKWPEAGLVIIDEAHILHKIHKDIMKTWNAVPVIGLSATPWTKGLGKHFQNMVANVSVSDLMRDGYLVPAVVYGPARPDLSKVRTVAGDYEESGSARESMRIIGDAVSHWLKFGENRPTAMFAVNIAHSQALVAEFIANGIKAEHVDAYTDSEERRAIFEKFDNGEIKIISSVDVIGRGWDQPKVSCLMLCRPTKSLMVHFQQIGRGLRTHEFKENCLVLDFAGNHERLGFVTDPTPDVLDTGEKKDAQKAERKEKLPKPCPKCHFLKTEHACPQCGFAPERQNQVEHDEGQLELIKGRAKQVAIQVKIDWYAQLRTYAKAKGYKEGWAARKYRDRFGVWPNDPRIRNAPPAIVSPEVANYIKYMNIKFHKGMAKYGTS